MRRGYQEPEGVTGFQFETMFAPSGRFLESLGFSDKLRKILSACSALFRCAAAFWRRCFFFRHRRASSFALVFFRLIA